MFICNKNLYKWIYVYMHTTFFWIFSLGLRKYVFTFNLFHVIFAWYYVYNTTWHLEIRKFRLRSRRRQWHPTPVLLPGKSHGRRTLVGFSPWGRKEFRHDWATSLSLLIFMHWRRKWKPTPVFLPGESQGRRSLVGCRLWGRTVSYMIEVT